MSRPGYNLLICPDSILLKEAIDEKIATAKIDSSGWKKLVIWGDEEPSDAFWKNLTQVGLFAENKLVIVRQADNWTANIWKELTEVLSRELSHIWIFLCLENPWEKGKPKIPAHILKNKLYTFAQQKKWIWQSSGLTDRTVAQFVKTQAKKIGLDLEGQLLNQFCSSLYPDGQSVINELNKLKLLAADGKITQEMLATSYTNAESNAFNLIKKIMAGNIEAAWRELSCSNDSGLLFFVIALFARELKQLWQICQGEPVRLFPTESGYKKSLAAKIGVYGVSSAFAALADAEWQVKSGQLSPEQTLEKLTLQLAKIFSQ